MSSRGERDVDMGHPGASFVRLCCASLALVVLAQVIAVAPLAADPATPVVVEGSPSGWVFSPDGDGFEDSWSGSWRLSEPVTVSVRVVDGAGVLVRSLLVDQPDDDFVDVSWDGLDDFGAVAAEGLYDVELSATDAQGDSVTDSVSVGVTQLGVPAVLSSPVDGSTVSGTIDLVATPVAGAAVTIMSVRFRGLGFSSPYGSESADGTWRTTFDTTGLADGADSLYASVSWTDELGWYHSRNTPSASITIDNTAPTASLVVALISGPAPLLTTFDIDVSDPQDLPLNYSVAFGDGASTSGQAFAPYATISLDHTYLLQGSYNATVLVTDSGGNSATDAVLVQVEPAETNEPPELALQVSHETGPAPLDVSLTLDASDPNDDPLRYTIDFGDGTDPLSGDLVEEPLTHRYAVPGYYLIQATVSDGQQSATEFARVTVVLPEPLVADAGDDRIVTVGDVVQFYGGGSSPQSLIGSYTWTFGDGGMQEGIAASHTYSAAGTYEASLRVPSDASAVALHVTSVSPSAGGTYLTLWPAGAEQPLAASMNVGSDYDHRSLSNDVVIVKVGDAGLVNVFNNAGSIGLVMDVVGYFVPEGGTGFVGMAPTRILDSRNDFEGEYSTPWAEGQTRTLQVGGRDGIPLTGVESVLLHVTSVGPTAPGTYVTVWPTDQQRPLAASMNVGTDAAHSSIVNDLIIAKVNVAGQIEVFNNSGSVDLVVDVVGYFAAGIGDELTITSPTRLLDSRLEGGPWADGETRRIQLTGLAGVPPEASTVLAHVTTVSPTATGTYLTVFAAGAAQPTAASLNVGRDEAHAALVNDLLVLTLGEGGAIDIYNNAGTVDLVIDVVGYAATG